MYIVKAQKPDGTVAIVQRIEDKNKAEALAFLLPRNSLDVVKAWVEEVQDQEEA